MTATSPREIPFNYTSADDRQAVSHLLGAEVWQKLEELRTRRVTGRSARLLMRFFGELLIHRRNPYLYQELVDSASLRGRFFGNIATDLEVVEQHAGGETRVLDIIRACRGLLEAFRKEVDAAPQLRRRMVRVLGGIVGKENVLFDPFTLVSHATDATDWRLHLPVSVVTPTDAAQVAPLLAAIGSLGLKAIPRGAGTGLTGGAVPLRPDCVVINTEKLNRIHGIEKRPFRLEDGRALEAPVLRLEAGVITEQAMDYAAERGLVFATDPTSAWACTIGGNIAENAGGKACVLWGTCIDNVIAFDMAMPSGARWTVRRLDHHLRKILPEDTVTFAVDDDRGTCVRVVTLRGTDIRKKGLWKDITNKALGGLPGIQKEGTDGVITSAEFILYPAYEQTSTLCLEFFGPDLDEASSVILKLSETFPNRGEEVLMALEHFDNEYVKAINYKVKAPRGEAPKAVLLIDVVGHTAAQTARGVETIRRLLAEHPNTWLFVASDAAEGKLFWADRKRLGAIAARTNAFKLNEDIVLPLEALAEFARFVEATNVEEERHNQKMFVHRAEEVLRSARSGEENGWLEGKIEAAVARCEHAFEALRSSNEKSLRDLAALSTLRKEFQELLRGYGKIGEALEETYQEVRARLIVIATHMHAGDGNVHVNIPVLSNDRAMMRRAELVVDKVMERVVELGGVVSGEHGIGVTKLKYLEPRRIAELTAYRAEVDPGGLMNPGKLEDLAVLEQIFTPSFNLLELEARILQHGQLEELAMRIAKCVRCGKCKSDCCVFHPARGLFYHPRNKNLAIGSLIEAMLYKAQRERSTEFELLRHLEDVADHCTICHKCVKPCPVDIDTGEVSVLEREILAARGYKRTTVATALSLRYLGTQSPVMNRVFHSTLVTLASAAQRAAAQVAAPLQPKEPPKQYALQILRSPVPPADPVTLREILPACAPDQALVLEPDEEARKTVFYFPGCGSERLFSRVSIAAVHVLLELGSRVILPPPFLCCGFPFHANARKEQYGRTVLGNTIVFSQIREMFSYLTFDACVVTCGTCREGLVSMEAPEIFGAAVVDIARYALDQGLRVEGGTDILYHPPCHDSLDGKGPQVLGKLGGYAVETVPHCCSEAGTLALSRPDITDAMLHRKSTALRASLESRPGGAVILTNCPSCLQGLGRNADLGVRARHIAVELAERMSGPGWLDRLRARAARAKPIHF